MTMVRGRFAISTSDSFGDADLREPDGQRAGADRRMAVGPWVICGMGSQRVRDAMAFTTCSASLPTPRKNPDDIA